MTKDVRLKYVVSLCGGGIVIYLGVAVCLIHYGWSLIAILKASVQAVSGAGILIALIALLYQIRKDQKLEKQKFDRVHIYVEAYCDELIATLASYTKDREVTPSRDLMSLVPIDLKFAENVLFNQYEYFLYPTNFNFRTLVHLVRHLIHENERVCRSVPRTGDIHNEAAATLLAQMNSVLMQMVESVVVSAAITRILDRSIQVDERRGHRMPLSSLEGISAMTGVQEARIREIARELRCRFEDD